MSETVRHGLALLSAGQAQKEITHNEALLAVDRLLHPAVLSASLTEPPALAAPGDAYIVAEPGGGEWAGFSGRLASHDGYGWTFTSPVSGCLVWIIDEGRFAVFDGSWSHDGWPVDALQISGRRVLGAAPVAMAAPAGGAVVDAESRASIELLISVLRDQGVVL